MKNNVIIALLCVLSVSCTKASKDMPNIVIIYADDMGYGDLNCQNSDSKIPTPNLDQLASEGMRFSDAHSSSGICSPSRFALLTGSYHWRRMHGIVSSFGKPMFKDSDVTLPQVLKAKGYETACIGKWHLGWDWNFKNTPSGERFYWDKTHKVYLLEDIDWESPIKGGPLDRGFDYYFGDGTINFPPYAWIENDRFLETPNDIFEFDKFAREPKGESWDSRPGPMVKGWDPYQVLPTLTKKTIEWINNRHKEQPFFLYFALPSPHMPIIPNDEFDGKSDAGAYGDFMYQTDFIVGEVLKAIQENGFEDNTLIIFSSDNGPESIAWERALKYNHFSMGQFRGLKRDVWEGGHHIPFIVKWPNHVRAGSVSDEVISQVDIMATISDIADIDLPENSAPDSYSFLSVLQEEEYQSPLREATIYNTNKKTWAIRKGDWLYINDKTGSNMRKMPEPFMKLRAYKTFKTPGLLFNMREDEEQRINLYNEYPEKVSELKKLLEDYRESKSTGYNKKYQ
jgi:arylsulfatase A